MSREIAAINLIPLLAVSQNMPESYDSTIPLPSNGNQALIALLIHVLSQNMPESYDSTIPLRSNGNQALIALLIHVLLNHEQRHKSAFNLRQPAK